MTQLTNWFKANKLTLNSDKSSFTIFKSSKKVIPNIPNQIEFLNQHIKRTSQIKFLRIIVDENLTFNEHVNDICNKLKRLFHIFYNIRDYLSKENIKTIYYALIYSRIKYGLSVYGQASNTKMKRIQTLQNQLLKVLAGKEYRFSTDKLHVEFELLKVKDISSSPSPPHPPPVYNPPYHTLLTSLHYT